MYWVQTQWQVHCPFFFKCHQNFIAENKKHLNRFQPRTQPVHLQVSLETLNWHLLVFFSSSALSFVPWVLNESSVQVLYYRQCSTKNTISSTCLFCNRGSVKCANLRKCCFQYKKLQKVSFNCRSPSQVGKRGNWQNVFFEAMKDPKKDSFSSFTSEPRKKTNIAQRFSKAWLQG